MIRVTRLNSSTFTIRGVGFKEEVTSIDEQTFSMIEDQLRRVEQMGLISIEVDKPAPKAAPKKAPAKKKRPTKKAAPKKFVPPANEKDPS